MRGTAVPASQRTLQELRLGGAANEDLRAGLVRLVLTVVEVVRQVLEKQAVRRIDAGDLSPKEVEDLGMAFLELKKALGEIALEFGMKPEELVDQLGGIVRTGDQSLDGASLVELLDKVVEKGAVVAGRVRISVSDIDLIALDLMAMLYPVYSVRRRRPIPRRK